MYCAKSLSFSREISPSKWISNFIDHSECSILSLSIPLFCIDKQTTKSALCHVARTWSFSPFYLKGRSDGSWQSRSIGFIVPPPPHSHDGATHGVTHGHRKYHHQLYVIPRRTSLPVLFFCVNSIAPCAPSSPPLKAANPRAFTNWLVTYRTYLVPYSVVCGPLRT